MNNNKTLADHAEEWTRENGEEVPERSTNEWFKMYQRWIEFAFASFSYSKTKRNKHHKMSQPNISTQLDMNDI